MTIRRAPRPDRYTVVPNPTIEDDRLSFKALGLLVYLLSKPDNWTVNRDHLAKTHTEGTEAVRSALRELRAAGYVTTETERGPDGRIASQGAVVHDRPQVAPSDPPPDGGKPATRTMPQQEETRVVTTEVQQLLNEQPVVRSREQLTLVAPEAPAAQPPPGGVVLGSDRDVWFAEFWDVYPRKTAKGAARKAWAAARRRGVPPERILAGARAYAADPNREAQFTAHPATWLNGERWDDEPEPDRRPASAAGRTVGAFAAAAAMVGTGGALPAPMLGLNR